VILGDHKTEKKIKRKNELARLDWDINTSYRSNYTHRPIGSGHQHGRALHTNEGIKDKSKTAAPPTNRTHASNEPWSEAHHRRKKLRGIHHRTEGPPPCGAQRRRSAAPTLTADNVKNTESEGTLACAGTTNPPLSTPLSRARGPLNPPHGTTLRSRLENCCRGSSKVPRPSETATSRIPPPRNEVITLLRPCTSRHYRAKGLKMSPAPSCDDVPHRELPAMLKTSPRSSTGQVFTDCRCRKRRPTMLSRTRWRLPSNARRRGTLQADHQQPTEDLQPPTGEQRRGEGWQTPMTLAR
jgi:hypothetical protein